MATASTARSPQAGRGGGGELGWSNTARVDHDDVQPEYLTTRVTLERRHADSGLLVPSKAASTAESARALSERSPLPTDRSAEVARALSERFPLLTDRYEPSAGGEAEPRQRRLCLHRLGQDGAGVPQGGGRAAVVPGEEGLPGGVLQGGAADLGAVLRAFRGARSRESADSARRPAVVRRNGERECQSGICFEARVYIVRGYEVDPGVVTS